MNAQRNSFARIHFGAMGMPVILTLQIEISWKHAVFHIFRPTKLVYTAPELSGCFLDGTEISGGKLFYKKSPVQSKL